MDIFEKACDEIKEEDFPAYLSNENCIEWTRGAKIATVTLCQKRLINKVKKYAEKYPDEFEIVAEHDGIVIAHIPTKTIRIQYFEPREMSPEFVHAAKERLAAARINKKKEKEKL